MFDYRQVAGTLNIVPELDRLIGRVDSNTGFIRRQAALAVASKPPLSLWGQLRTPHSGGSHHAIDIKESGLFPVIEMARALALTAGITAPSTLDRLHGVAEQKEWSDTCASLEEVFRVFQQVRVRN